MKKILFVLQIVLKLTLIFCLIFVWTRFFIKSFILSLIISISATILIEFTFRLIGRKKANRQNMKIKEKEEAENMFLSLSTSSYLPFFLSLAKVKHQNCIKDKHYIIISHDETDKTILYPFMSFSPIKPDDIASIIKETKKIKPEKIVIVCGEKSKEAIAFSKNFTQEIVILDKFDSYFQLYKSYNYFPEIHMEYKKEKILAFKDLIGYSFNRERCKGYVFASLILFMSSFFIRPGIYYCIIASMLLLFALVSYTNPYFNSKNSQEIL